MKMSDLTPQEQRIMSGFRKMTPRQQEIFRQIVWLLGEFDDTERKTKDQFWEMFAGHLNYESALNSMDAIRQVK
jgi:hypothetical protein